MFFFRRLILIEHPKALILVDPGCAAVLRSHDPDIRADAVEL